MVVVRLAKSGAKKNPYYFITVADSRKPRDGAFIERLGFFNPSAKGSEERMRFNIESLDHWIGQGAQLSDKVKELAKDARLSPDELQEKLDAKKEKRVTKKEAIKAKKVAELEAMAKEAAAEVQPKKLPSRRSCNRRSYSRSLQQGYNRRSSSRRSSSRRGGYNRRSSSRRGSSSRRSPS